MEKKARGELGESEGTPVNVLKRSIVPVYWIQVYPLIGRHDTASVNTQVPVMLMRNATGIICYRIT